MSDADIFFSMYLQSVQEPLKRRKEDDESRKEREKENLLKEEIGGVLGGLLNYPGKYVYGIRYNGKNYVFALGLLGTNIGGIIELDTNEFPAEYEGKPLKIIRPNYPTIQELQDIVKGSKELSTQGDHEITIEYGPNIGTYLVYVNSLGSVNRYEQEL